MDQTRNTRFSAKLARQHSVKPCQITAAKVARDLGDDAAHHQLTAIGTRLLFKALDQERRDRTEREG